MNLAPFLIAMVLMFLAQILTFYQIQGPLKINWFKNNYWLVVLMGIPISMMYMKSIKYLVEAYNGLIWRADIVTGKPIYLDRKSTRLNSSHSRASRMPSSA